MAIDLSDPFLFQATFAVLIGGLGGFIRGISGFGSALAMVPALSLVIPADQAIAAVVLVIGVTNLPLVATVWRSADWNAVFLILVASVIALPVGIYLLVLAPIDLLRRAAGIVVLATCAFLIFSRRLQIKGSRSAKLAAGAASGVLQGALSLGGPPIVLFFLATGRAAHVSRASFLVYFTFLQAINIPALFVTGIVDWSVIRWALLMTPLMLLGSIVGERIFLRGGHRHFRSIAIAILCVTAILAIVK